MHGLAPFPGRPLGEILGSALRTGQRHPERNFTSKPREGPPRKEGLEASQELVIPGEGRHAEPRTFPADSGNRPSGGMIADGQGRAWGLWAQPWETALACRSRGENCVVSPARRWADLHTRVGSAETAASGPEL